MSTWPNKPAAGQRRSRLSFRFGHCWPGVPRERSAIRRRSQVLEVKKYSLSMWCIPFFLLLFSMGAENQPILAVKIP